MSDLVKIEEKTVLAAFSTGGGLDPIISQAKDLVEEFEHDLSTAAGRSRTASLAAKVAKLKTRLDGMGKDLVSDWKSKAKVVDASRKSMRDELDELKVIARKPLTDWEQEQEQIEAEKAAIEAAEKLKAEIENSHEMGLLINADFERKKAELEADLKRERDSEQAKIRAEAAEAAKAEADAAARAEIERVEKEKQAAIDREISAKAELLRQAKELQESEERAKQASELAERNRVLAAEKAAKDAAIAAEMAKQAEIDRQRKERDEIASEKAKREANIENVRQKNNEALFAIVRLGVTEEKAKAIVVAIAKNKIPNVIINY